MTKTKKVGIAGRFGPRYGKKIRQLVIDVEKKQKCKHICPFCKKLGIIKRLSPGIWNCKKCDKVFTGKAYTIGE